MQEFANTVGTVWDGVVGSAPLCPGDRASLPFTIDIAHGQPLYFSYASMILPSNDAFIANGNPMANLVIAANGGFREFCINEFGDEVLDAGTEVNDELPKITAFFGQMTPESGTDEGGVVMLHPGFNAVGSGGILDDPEFANADFTADGFRTIRICVERMDDDGESNSSSSSPSKKGGKKGKKGGKRTRR